MKNVSGSQDQMVINVILATPTVCLKMHIIDIYYKKEACVSVRNVHV